ncbi:MAG: OadG family protein [Bacteroidales bacterium]|nr:OadG family protein [Bacteroidales bacterium]
MINLLNMTAGAERMAQTDPHGWTLALIAVTTVFTALVILYFIYSFIGKASNSKVPRVKRSPRKGSAPDAETAAAIAMALEAENGGEVNAAIAMALHLYFNDAVHDIEPGIITFAPRATQWNDKSLTFRKTPRK